MAARLGFNRDSKNTPTSVPGIFSTRSGAKFMSGARTVLKINGRVVGFAFSVSWSIQTDAREIYTIDDVLPHEIAPTKILVEGTLGLLQIPGRSPQNERIQSDSLAFLSNKYITIEIRDSSSDQLIFKADKAIVTNQQSQINADDMATTTLNWKAVGWQAETPPQPPEPAQ